MSVANRGSIASFSLLTPAHRPELSSHRDVMLDPISWRGRSHAKLMVEAGSTGTDKGRRTQWVAQFLAAAELVRRNYIVTFTTGNNTPIADLMVGTRQGEQFWVDVKGLSSRTNWPLKPKPAFKHLFYVLVHLAPLAGAGREREPDRFFILSQAEANGLEAAYRKAHPGTKGTRPGFGFSAVTDFEDQWDKLPS
jgi:hypothetical protein